MVLFSAPRSMRRPVEPVSTRMWSIVWHVVVPVAQIVTVTKGTLLEGLVKAVGPLSTTTASVLVGAAELLLELDDELELLDPDEPLVTPPPPPPPPPLQATRHRNNDRAARHAAT